MARLSKTAVLRAGYGAVILVLIFCAIEAYRIQIGVSKQHLGIYRQFVQQDNSVATLRRNLWLAGNDVRDFFINTTPEQADALRTQIQALKADDEQALRFLAKSTGGAEIVPRLRKSLDEFWAVVDPIPVTMLHQSKAAQFEFLEREIAPRRGQLYSTLIDFTLADQERLQESEKEFGDARRGAAQRLLLMLGLGVLLSFIVARQSLRYAENLERQAQRHFADVEQARKELQKLSARLLEIEEEDRRRLARELHDEIGQTLALLQIEITNAQSAVGVQPEVLRQRLQRARELASRTVQTIRNISLLLRPALLDDLGLVPALQFQLEDFLRRSGIACEFTEEGVEDALPDAVKTCIYRIVQEALHNCEKHSGATKVRVVVRQLPECLTAEVEDNGRGFQLNEQRMPLKSAGLGLLGIRERTAIAGGSLIIDSAPGQGTRIAVKIPIPSAGASVQEAPPKEVTA